MSHSNDTGPKTYGLLAEFDTPEQLVDAIKATRAAGYTKLDAHTPFAIHEVMEAVGFKRSEMQTVLLIGGFVGCCVGFFMQYFLNGVDYPMNIGGKQFLKWPAYIPITFEMTVLTTAFTGLFAFAALCGFPCLYHPLFNVPRFALATRDKFFLSLEATDPKFDAVRTRDFLLGLKPHEVSEVPL